MLLLSQSSHLALAMTVLLCVLISVIMNAVDASAMRKLDENSIPGTPDIEIKCTTCSPCENPCTQNQLAPPPPKNLGMQYCPPPPPPPFVYIAGLEGGMYPLDPYYSGGDQICTSGLHVWVVFWLIGLSVFWRL